MSAPQPSVLNAATRFCAVFGHPVKHSASPAMQNAGIGKLKLNWRYLACDVKPENLREAIEGARVMGFIGLNLTVPHKLLALEMMDELDVSAKLWGAVNTVRFEGRSAKGGWLPLDRFQKEPPVEFRSVGFNTDAEGLVAALREDLKLKLRNQRVLVLGAGGAGRTAALKFAAEGVNELFVVNRTRAKAMELISEIEKQFPSVYTSANYPKAEVDLVVNATSLGLKPSDPLPFDGGRFSLKQAKAVFDMIYRPAETPLLKAARKAGCKTANGLGMLLHQGAKALEIWSGKRAPVAVMRQALEKEVYGS